MFFKLNALNNLDIQQDLKEVLKLLENGENITYYNCQRFIKLSFKIILFLNPKYNLRSFAWKLLERVQSEKLYVGQVIDSSLIIDLIYEDSCCNVQNSYEVPNLLSWILKSVTRKDVHMAVKHHVTDLVQNRDMATLASLISTLKIFQDNPHVIPVGQHLVSFCEYIVDYLAKIQTPRDPAEIGVFLENVTGVRNFLKELCEHSKSSAEIIVASSLRQLYSILSNKDIEPCAPVSVVLCLVEPPLIPQAVSWLLSENPCDEDLKRSLRILAGWLRYCNYTPYLSEWVICFLRGLQDQRRWDILIGACVPVVEELITSLIVPAIRPSVKPALLHMLMSVKHTPVLLKKISPRITPILQQLSREGTEESHKVKQELIDVIMALFDIFPEEKLKHADIIYRLTMMGPSAGYKRVLDVLPFSAPHVPTGIRVGLSNLGNTCYMNSVLQALFMTKQFFREVLISPHKCPILEHLADLFALLKHSHRPQLAPRGMLQRATPAGFTPGQQQDSSEFLSYLLDVLHEQEIATINNNRQKSIGNQNETGSIKRWPTEEDLSNEIIPSASLKIEEVDSNGVENISESIVISNNKFKTENKENKLEDTTSNDKKHQGLGGDGVTSYLTNNINNSQIGSSGDCKNEVTEESLVQKCFGGQLKTGLHCLQCGFRSDNRDNFRDMQLAFPDNYVNSEAYTVQRLLDFYLSKELLQGENRYSCEQCQTLCEAERSIDIIAAPKVLILTLKHFKYDPTLHTRTKLLHKVSFRDMSISINVTSTDGRENYKVFYMLYAAVVHSGVNMDCGHYYTYAMDKLNTWYKFNDSVVTESSIDELHSLNPPNTPYILFYKQIGQMHITPCVKVEENFENGTGTYMDNNHCLNDENNLDMLNNVNENCIDDIENVEMIDHCNEDWKTSKIELDPNIVLVDEMDNDFDFTNLPNHLQDLILRDNSLYDEEMTSNLKMSKPKPNNIFLQHRRDRDEDDPPSNCGGNSGFHSDANRFIY